MGTPLALNDMIFFLGAATMLLMLTSEIMCSYYGRVNVLVEKRRLRSASLFISALFLVAILIGVYSILIQP